MWPISLKHIEQSSFFYMEASNINHKLIKPNYLLQFPKCPLEKI